MERPAFACQHPDGCPRPARKLGWCSMHYNRLRTTGEVGPAGKLTNWGEHRGQTCSIEGCEDPAALKGWCRFHYDRVRFKGEPGSAAPLKRRLPPEVRGYTPGERHRFYKYGLTPEAFAAILARQGGRCYVCRTEEPNGYGWSVDHCHETNVVRFIACNPCNAALGLIKEDPAIAKRLYEVTLDVQQLKLIRKATTHDPSRLCHRYRAGSDPQRGVGAGAEGHPLAGHGPGGEGVPGPVHPGSALRAALHRGPAGA